MKRDRQIRKGTMFMKWCSAAVCVLLGAMLSASAASAYEIKEYGEALYSNGNFERQAGSHPDFITHIQLDETGFRSVELELPPGLLANPTAVDTCTSQQIIGREQGARPACPATSQVGVIQTFEGDGQPSVESAIYNLQAPSDLPALLAFNIAGVVTKIEPRVRQSDFGITADTDGIGQGLSLDGAEVRLWGVPADPVHDSERYNPVTSAPPFNSETFEAARKPFLTAPTSCAATPSTFKVSTDSWWEPGIFQNAAVSSDPSGTPFVFENCGRLQFEPTARIEPDMHAAAAPLGLKFSLTVPQSEAAYGLSTPDVKRAVLKFPTGVSVSPSAASGLGACGLAEIKLGSDASPTCPASSRIGSVTVKSPLLADPLEGEVIIARQNENPFNSLLAMYLVIRGPGILLKLPGRVDLDQASGQVTAEFNNTPQLPFETLTVELEGGPKAPLAAPSACGTFTTQAELTSWASSTPVSVSAPMTINQGCANGGFSPKLNAGTADPTGGSFSPFTLQVTRKDGEANLSRIDATLPPGLLAKLAGVPLCGDAQASSGNCPAASQVGTTTVGAGAGPNPLYVPEAGKAPTAVYLAGPYRGAPYSLIVKVPAQAGPFDLGTVVVRNALQIDPFTTQVTAESDPLPQILEGIPISYRDVRVEINRPEFTVNPTNCSQFSVTSLLTSATGQTASPKAPFAAANCERLEFKPTLQLQLKGSTKRVGHPGLKAVLTYPKKGSFANIARAQVNLPGSVFLDQGNLNKTCTKPVLLEGRCPKSTVYGKAKVWSPLLETPLQGNVYLVGGFGYKLPALVADLNGQIHVLLKSKVDSGSNKGIRTTFEAVPDAPVSRFVLEMKGGPKYSLLENSTNLCKSAQKLKAAFTAQNGKTDNFEQKIAVKCGNAKKSKKGK
jgi:hypothetical protein